VVGLSLEKAQRPFHRIQLDFRTYRRNGIEIHEAGACSGCRHVVQALLFDYLKDRLDLLKDRTLIFGQTVTPPARVKGKLLNLGLCTKQYKDQGEYIPGCPPHPHDVMAYLRERRS
jgi:hypothetical protein